MIFNLKASNDTAIMIELFEGLGDVYFVVNHFGLL